MQFYEINICQIMIFRHNTVHNKHEIIKFSSQTREKTEFVTSDRLILLKPVQIFFMMFISIFFS